MVYVVIICMKANGTSSYRDTRNVSKLVLETWDSCSRVLILTDTVKHLKGMSRLNKVEVQCTPSKRALLYHLHRFVSSVTCPNASILFVLSAHGYSTTATQNHRHLEMNGRSEYIIAGRDRVMDHELFRAFYEPMLPHVFSLCIIDTCHSGTMLDLEYLSTDGIRFRRSNIELCKRPRSICISACNDQETAGEDISDYGGWGGKLVCQFLDFVHSSRGNRFHILSFYHHVRRLFTTQSCQRSHPVISFNDEREKE